MKKNKSSTPRIIKYIVLILLALAVIFIVKGRLSADIAPSKDTKHKDMPTYKIIKDPKTGEESILYF